MGGYFWEIQEQLKTAEYGVVTASLSNDFREAVSFNLRKHKVRTKCTLFFLVFLSKESHQNHLYTSFFSRIISKKQLTIPTKHDRQTFLITLFRWSRQSMCSRCLTESY